MNRMKLCTTLVCSLINNFVSKCGRIIDIVKTVYLHSIWVEVIINERPKVKKGNKLFEVPENGWQAITE